MKKTSSLAAWPIGLTRETGVTLGLIICLAGLTLIVYWPSWSIPLSYDSAWFIRLVHEFSIADAFTQTASSGYYRPLISIFFRWSGTLGTSAALVLHGIGFGVEVANAWLLGRVARALWGKPNFWLEGSAGFLLILNPLNAQTVALASGLNHLPTLLFILFGTLAYVSARQSGRWRDWLFCGLACGLAFLTHELGVMVGAYCLVYEVTVALRERRWRRGAWACLLVLGLSAGYMLVYSLIPKGQAVDWVWTPGDILLRGLYVMQSLAYPAAFLLNGLRPAVAAVVVAGCLIVAGALLALKGRWGIFVLAGAALAVGAALPSVLRLPAEYLLNSPRVLYVSCAGVALLWAGLVQALASRLQKAEMAGRLILLAIVGLIGFWHIQSQETLLQRAHEPVTAMVEQALTLPPEGNLLVLNFPEWVAPPQRHFPIGSEGALLTAKYIDGGDLVLANTGLHRQVTMRQYPIPYQPELPYAYQAFGGMEDMAGLASLASKATQVLEVHYSPAGPYTSWLGGVMAAGAGESQVVFGKQLALTSVEATPCELGWVLVSSWRRLEAGHQKVPSTVSAFVQVLDAAGAKLGQADGPLLGGLLPFDKLPDGYVVDRRILKLAAPPASDTQLYLGLYNYESGERLQAETGGGDHLDGDAFSMPLPALSSAPCK